MRSFILLIIAVLLGSPFFLHAQSLQSIESKQGKIEGEELETWYLKGKKDVKAYGVEADRALKELIGDREPKKRVVVAIIDSGVDIEHEDLEDHLWTNEGEVPGNGKDDDGNGFADDIHGWNFLVDDNGENMRYANLEATRVLRLSRDLQMSDQPFPDWLTKETLEQAANIFNSQTEELNGYYQFVAVYRRMDSAVISVLNDTGYTYEDVKTITSEDPAIVDAKKIFEIFEKLEIAKSDLQEMDQLVTKYTDYWLNLDYQPRAEINFDREHYGNAEVGGEHTSHGTHVAGIVAANAENDLGGRGIAASVAELMVLKVVPDGDENDIDVANGIRYAVDNGANIINMSFGKGLSPAQDQVNAALEYAAENNVLVIHAAGNDADDSDEVPNFPNDETLSEKGRSSFLTIGAIGPRKNKRMVASFSNYGDTVVDIFAPGEDIYATLPSNRYGFQSGTSMAAPVVSGVAALVWAYHPELTAAELKEVILSGGKDLERKKVVLPGTRKEKVRFGTLSTSGRVVDLYESFRLAGQ